MTEQVIVTTPEGPRFESGGLGMRQQLELLRNLVGRELKARYKGSVLGFLWAVLIPLFMAGIYVFFLRLLAGGRGGLSIENVLVGVFAWQFTAASVQGGLVCVTGSSNLVKKVAFPRVMLPVAATVSNLVGFLLSLLVLMPVLAVLLWRAGDGFGPWIGMLPVLILWQMVFNLSLSMLLGAANVYFRDAQHLVGVLLTAWFFVSPAMYDLSLVETLGGDRPWLMSAYMLNPMAPLLTAYRAAILPHAAFPCTAWAVAGLAWPALLAVAGWFVYRRAQRNFADHL